MADYGRHGGGNTMWKDIEKIQKDMAKMKQEMFQLHEQLEDANANIDKLKRIINDITGRGRTTKSMIPIKYFTVKKGTKA